MIFSVSYYFIFNLCLLYSVVTSLKKLFSITLYSHHIQSLVSRSFLGFLIFYTFYLLLTLHSLLSAYQNTVEVILTSQDSVYFIYTLYEGSFYSNGRGSNVLRVYYFPFLYVFIFITILSIMSCLAYNQDELGSFILYCLIILFSGYIMFETDSIILFFFSYELLLIPSFFILYKFAKTRRCVEAAYLMFFWTQFGALFLIFGLLYLLNTSNSLLFSQIQLCNYSTLEVNFVFICFLVGFGVKLPIWPFYGWLPKAHVEASTNFSIFLSGVLVKFAFFGLYKLLLTIRLEPTCYLVLPLLLVGVVDSVMKIFTQNDLKKVVAYSTVVEMHWLTICVISGQSNLLLSGFCMLISHALLSSNSFLLVDAIARRFKTRLITEMGGLNFLCPKLFLFTLTNTLIFLGFPGSLFFIAEFLFFSFMFDMFPSLMITLLIFLYLLGPTFFFRSWMNLMFTTSIYSYKSIPLDITTRELIIFSTLLFMLFWLGINWQSFIF